MKPDIVKRKNNNNLEKLWWFQLGHNILLRQDPCHCQYYSRHTTKKGEQKVRQVDNVHSDGLIYISSFFLLKFATLEKREVWECWLSPCLKDQAMFVLLVKTIVCSDWERIGKDLKIFHLDGSITIFLELKLVNV